MGSASAGSIFLVKRYILYGRYASFPSEIYIHHPIYD
jgi:hypothetical protein